MKLTEILNIYDLHSDPNKLDDVPMLRKNFYYNHIEAPGVSSGPDQHQCFIGDGRATLLQIASWYGVDIKQLTNNVVWLGPNTNREQVINAALERVIPRDLVGSEPFNMFIDASKDLAWQAVVYYDKVFVAMLRDKK